MKKLKIQIVSVYNSLITDSIKEMISLAKRGGYTAKQELNGVVVLVNGDSDVNLIFRDQQRAQSGYISKKVGPYPKAELSAEDIANDNKIQSANEKRWAEEDKKRQVIQKKKEEEFSAELAICPTMERNEEEWKKGIDAQKGDGYGLACYTFAEYWARLMQKGISEGKQVKDIADECSHKADIPCGITGFMYGCSVSILAHCWKYGEELRRWHNKETQLGTEGDKANENGGVLNPAMLSISM
jgi:hypothetical protein